MSRKSPPLQTQAMAPLNCLSPSVFRPLPSAPPPIAGFPSACPYACNLQTSAPQTEADCERSF